MDMKPNLYKFTHTSCSGTKIVYEIEADYLSDILDHEEEE
jgi:hypothetical protein